MNEDERKNHSYIGDGVYAEFDGIGFWLRTGNHKDYLCDNNIYLEVSVLNDLFKFVDFHLKPKNPEEEE